MADPETPDSTQVATGDRARPHAAVVYNPKKLERSRLNSLVDGEAERRGWGTTEWLETDPDDSGAQAARTAVEHGAAVVLVAGGDGTVRVVAEELASTGVPVALVPAGTGNVLARNLELNLSDLSVAVKTAFGGENRPVDVGMADITRPDGTLETKAFVVMAGLGLDAEIMVATNSRFKRLFGWVAYVSGAFRAVNRSTRFHASITTDRRRSIRTRSDTVLICNCGALPGGLLLVPDAAIDDGELDVLTISPKRLRDWFGIWRRIVVEHPLSRSRAGQRLIQLGGTRRLTTLSHSIGRTVSVRIDGVRPCELDGDVFGEAVAIDARVSPGALLVRVPQR
ncbi:diacylglycerol/lipid kinase family protein [Pseudoclavibacter soli]|uniref:diacylglycerol/lipid kinase family protein n=1 Tax=Pseudoclavibacter soli TaxID=452623 RepID=UPI000413C8A3|nr:diacylglycerol kinase family protein [Pseudoclavibacter soli]